MLKAIRYLRVAFTSILAHKMRAALTMLGIVIGVAAVLTTVGIGSGAAASITERIESSGTNLLTVRAGASGGATGGSAGSTLTMADAATWADPALFPDLAAVAPEYSSSATLSTGLNDGSYQVVGVTANYAGVKSLDFAAGAFFDAEQVAANERAVVLGATVASDLFGRQDAVGETIRIDNNLFQVVGVLAEAGGGGFGSSDSQAYVPIEVAQGLLFNAPRYRGSYTLSAMSVQAASSEQLDVAEAQIQQVLRLRHGLGADDDNDFTLLNQADLLEMASDVSGMLTALLGSIGAVSLLVGGIGIMNIMLVSVTERTREIGLRKAVGAHDSDILLQFLIEALVLCALGGAVGIGLSFGAALALGSLSFMPFGIVIEPWSVLLALAVSTASGFVFGIYPAFRATQLDPIEALRYE